MLGDSVFVVVTVAVTVRTEVGDAIVVKVETRGVADVTAVTVATLVAVATGSTVNAVSPVNHAPAGLGSMSMKIE